MNEIINSNIKRLIYNDKMTVLWILSLKKGMKKNGSQSKVQKYSPKGPQFNYEGSTLSIRGSSRVPLRVSQGCSESIELAQSQVIVTQSQPRLLRVS